MPESVNYGVSKGTINNHGGAVAIGTHATANASTSRSDAVRLVEQLRALLTEHADHIENAQRYAALGALEDIRTELAANTPKRSRITAALDMLKSSAGSATALITAVSNLSDAIEHLPH